MEDAAVDVDVVVVESCGLSSLVVVGYDRSIYYRYPPNSTLVVSFQTILHLPQPGSQQLSKEPPSSFLCLDLSSLTNVHWLEVGSIVVVILLHSTAFGKHHLYLLLMEDNHFRFTTVLAQIVVPPAIHFLSILQLLFMGTN